MQIIFDMPTAKLAVFMGSKIVEQMIGALSSVQPATPKEAIAALIDLGFTPPAVRVLGPLALKLSGIASPLPPSISPASPDHHEVTQ